MAVARMTDEEEKKKPAKGMLFNPAAARADQAAGRTGSPYAQSIQAVKTLPGRAFPATAAALDKREAAIADAPTIGSKIGQAFRTVPSVAAGVYSDVTSPAIRFAGEVATGQPAQTSKQPASVTTTPPVPRADDMVGEYKRELTPGGVRYSGPAGTMEGRGTGGGTYSEVSGPGRGNMSQQQWNALPNEERIARNVASYEGQTQAIRDARNAGRAARGERPVGQRADEEVLVMGEAPKETDQIRTERLLTDMVEEGTPKDRRTAIELLANMNTPVRPGKGEAPTFADQLGVARFGLDTAKAEADALQATRQNQIASAREERENMLANLQLNKADKEMMRERVTEIENSSLGTYGLPPEMLAGMERGLAKQLGNVDDTTIAANLQMELEEMRKNGNLPEKPDLAKLDQAALMKKVYDRIQRAQEKEE